MILGYGYGIYRIVFLIAATAGDITFFYIISTGIKITERCTAAVLGMAFTGSVQLNIAEIIAAARVKVGLAFGNIILNAVERVNGVSVRYRRVR